MNVPKDVDAAVEFLVDHLRELSATDPEKARALVAEVKEGMRAIFQEKGLPVPEELEALESVFQETLLDFLELKEPTCPAAS